MNPRMQLACFMIGEERYAADIMLIKEIILCRKVTHIPKAPDFIEGVINLRERVIPVIDMRKRLGLQATELTGATRIIITKVEGKNVGIIVDSVLKILRVGEGDIQPPPGMIKGIESEYLSGIVRDGDELILILDMGRVLTTTEKGRLDDIFSLDRVQEV